MAEAKPRLVGGGRTAHAYRNALERAEAQRDYLSKEHAALVSELEVAEKRIAELEAAGSGLVLKPGQALHLGDQGSTLDEEVEAALMERHADMESGDLLVQRVCRAWWPNNWWPNVPNPAGEVERAYAALVALGLDNFNVAVKRGARALDTTEASNAGSTYAFAHRVLTAVLGEGGK
jgi:hypothetical protein